jgi:hypothetical protein
LVVVRLICFPPDTPETQSLVDQVTLQHQAEDELVNSAAPPKRSPSACRSMRIGDARAREIDGVRRVGGQVRNVDRAAGAGCGERVQPSLDDPVQSAVEQAFLAADRREGQSVRSARRNVNQR